MTYKIKWKKEKKLNGLEARAGSINMTAGIHSSLIE